MAPPSSSAGPAGVGAATWVSLVGFPTRLFLVAHEQWEALLREYSLRGMGGTQQTFDHEEINRARQALYLLADAVDASPGQLGELSVLVEHPGDFAMLQAVIHDARRLAIAGELLVVPTLPEIAALRNWIGEEVPAQASGAAPCAWRSDVIHADPDGPPAVRWDASIVPDRETAWVLADDHNRIVDASPPAARLFGWDDELVGQRLLAIIPPELREAHIAGFIRSTVSGSGGLLGTPLPLPALRKDGTQVPIWLTITRHAAHDNRHVYVGALAPRDVQP